MPCSRRRRPEFSPLLAVVGLVGGAGQAAQLRAALAQAAVDRAVGRAGERGDLAVAVAQRQQLEVAPLARLEPLQVGHALGVLRIRYGEPPGNL